jgi:hypothetical protein
LKLRVLGRLIAIHRALARHGFVEFTRGKSVHGRLRLLGIVSPWLWFHGSSKGSRGAVGVVTPSRRTPVRLRAIRATYAAAFYLSKTNSVWRMLYPPFERLGIRQAEYRCLMQDDSNDGVNGGRGMAR